VYAAYQFAHWDDTSDPEVAAYLEAMHGSSEDPRSENVVWGYSTVMWIRTVADTIGADNLNPQSLANFMRTQNGVPIPRSRELVNPGPAGEPQMKHPYVHISQWLNGKLNTVQVAGAADGWVKAF
jgi:hypothetical protein